MCQTESQTRSGAAQLTILLAGCMVAPVATPALIWISLAAGLPLAAIILVLFATAIFSECLSRILVRFGKLAEPVGIDSVQPSD